MKQYLFLSLAICISFACFSQCNVSTFIADNYELDGALLALREILDDPNDPDYDNPFVPYERMEPYLEKLSAVHANPDNNPRIDSLFNEFEFHVNPWINQVTEYKRLWFKADMNVPWVQNLKDTGVSGYQELDDFLATYQLEVEDTFTFNGNIEFFMVTTFEYLNIQALLDDMVSFDDVINVFLGETEFLGLNYTGVPYIIRTDFGSDYAEACDISIFLNSPETYVRFQLMGGGCASGCIFDESRSVSVSDDCQTIQGLSVSENSLSKLLITPNPASTSIQVINNIVPIQQYSIYSVDGKKQTSQEFTTTIDISSLPSGLYFIKFISEEGIQLTKKFIKK